MEKKLFKLEDITRLYHTIELIDSRLFFWQEKIEKAKGCNFEEMRIQGGHNQYILEETLQIKKELEEKKKDILEELKKKEVIFFEVISKIENFQHRKFLLLRYLENKSFSKIGEEMGYTKDYIFKIYKKARQEFYAILKEK